MVTKVETTTEPSQLPDEEKQKTDIVKQMRSLLSTINSACKEANTSLDSLVKKVDQQEVNVRNGISILDVKYQSKLMYLTNIAYLVMKRLHGQQISRDEAIERLVELRTVLERIRPLEQKLKYHIDKYIKIATRGETDPNDPTSFKANPDMMNDASDEEEEEEGKKKKKKNKEDEDGKKGIYKPPRLMSVQYDGDETRNEKQARSLERARKRALSSNLMQELKEEYLDRPMEYSHSSSNTLKNVISQREQERQDYEETYFTRLPLEKKKKSSFHQMTLNSIGDQVTRFEDLSVLHGGGGGGDYEPGAKKRKKQMMEGKKKKGGGKGKAKGKKRKFK
uniref:Neuroguidin n=2 Tax=Cacopsylla melanoneura TaxID=428564 RepID=A0A8D9BE72_9HEMI